MKTWEDFEELRTLCDMYMIGAHKDGSCWDKAYEMLMLIINEKRQLNPNYGSTVLGFHEEDEDEDAPEIYFFLDEYLDVLELGKRFDDFHRVTDQLIEVFKNDRYSVNDTRFRKSVAYRLQGKKQKAVDYCKQWVLENENDIKPNTALVYALNAIKAYEEANVIVQKFLPDLSDCNESNENMFYAAQELYKAMKKRKELKQINKAIADYEDYLDQQLEEEFDFDDDDNDDLWFYD